MIEGVIPKHEGTLTEFVADFLHFSKKIVLENSGLGTLF